MSAWNGKSFTTLWTYLSCDVLLVYNRVLQSSGASVSYAGDELGSSGLLPTRTEDTFFKLDVYDDSRRDLSTGLSTDLSTGRISGGYKVVQPEKSGQEEPWRTSRRASKNSGRGALNGDLALVQIPTLLQSVLMAKMTGCLEVKRDDEEAEVFFVNGLPTHARSATSASLGEEILYELLSWKDGDFHFEPDKRSDAATF